MSKVIFKKGLFANLPNSAEDNVLLFATDVGRLYQGNGIGKQLTEYSDLITGYANLIELKTANPKIEHKLYVTDDDNIYIYKNGEYKPFNGHKHKNFDVLSKLSEDENGNLLYDGKLIEGVGNGGFSSSLKKLKLKVVTDEQTEFTTELKPETPIEKMEFYLVIGNNIYIDEISISLNGDGKVVVTYDNTGFNLETTDSVYLLYSEEIENTGGGSGGTVDVDLSGYMDKETYVSDVNDGNVKKSDSALKIDGVEKVQPLTYYGTDVNGNVGFHILPVDSSKEGDVEQRVLLNVKSGQSYTMQSKNDMSESKAIVQVYKFVQGEQDVISTIKTFNNGEKDNFYYDKSNISFSDGCSIKNEFDLKCVEDENIFEYELINKKMFNDIILKKRGENR